MGEKVLPASTPQLKEHRETLARGRATMADGAEPARPDARGSGG